MDNMQLDNELLSEENLHTYVSKHETEAKELLEDTDKLERFLQRLSKKLENIPVVGTNLSYIPMLVSLVRAYTSKKYTDAPLGSIIAIVCALIYFVSPIDIIPDSVPALGYIDDALVLGFVWKMVGSDVEEYTQWLKNNDNYIE